MPRLRNSEGSSAPPPVVITKEVRTQTTTAPMEADSQPDTQDRIDINDWFASIPTGELKNYNFYLNRISEDIRNADNPEADTYMIRFIAPELPIDTSPNSRQRSLAELTAIDSRLMAALKSWTADNAGAGGFRLMVNNKKLGTTIYGKKFRVEGQPKAMNFEMFRGGAPANGAGSDSDFKKFLIEQIKELREGAKAGGQPVTNFDTMLEMVNKANTQAIDMAKAQVAPGKDPVESLASLMGILKDMGVVKGTVQGEASELDKFLERMAKMQELGMIPKPNNNPAPAPEKDSLIKDVATNVVETLRNSGMLSKRVAPAGTNWGWVEPLVKTSVPVLLPLLARFIPGAGAGARTAEQPIVLSRTPAANPPGNGAAMPLPLPGDNPPAAAPDNAEPGPSAPAAPQSVTITPEVMNQLRWHDVTRAIVDWIRHDMNGAEAAQTIKNMFPDQCAQLAVMNPVLLKGFIQSDPVLSTVKDHPKLDEFIEEFHAQLNPPPEGEGEDEAN